MANISVINKNISRKIIYLVVSVIILICLIAGGGLYLWVQSHGGDNDTAKPASAETLVAQSNEKLDKELATNKDSQDRAELLQAKISTFESIGRYDEAIKVANELATDSPQVAGYQADIGRLYGLAGDNKKSANYYRAALTLLDNQPATNESKIERDYYADRLGVAEGSN